MELIAIGILAMSILTPILCIAAFIIGYNVNAPKKILAPKPKKKEPTEDEKMLARIDNAKV